MKRIKGVDSIEAIEDREKIESNDSTWFVYIILSNDGSYYTGITTDIVRRWHEHVAVSGGSDNDTYKEEGSHRSHGSRKPDNGRKTHSASKTKGAKFFRGRRPKQLVYAEGNHSRSTASKREAEIKAMRRAAKSALINSSSNEISLISQLSLSSV